MSPVPQEQPGYETRKQVFAALLAEYEQDHASWWARWQHAEHCEQQQHQYDNAWTNSLRGVTTFGQ